MRKIPLFLILSAIGAAASQDSAGGRAIFENRCASCHGADANGGEFAFDFVPFRGLDESLERRWVKRVAAGFRGRGNAAIGKELDGEPLALAGRGAQAEAAHTRGLPHLACLRSDAFDILWKGGDQCSWRRFGQS